MGSSSLGWVKSGRLYPLSCFGLYGSYGMSVCLRELSQIFRNYVRRLKCS